MNNGFDYERHTMCARIDQARAQMYDGGDA